jgi:transcription initiation factor TFIIIB Brf1 subunit/transcription initiation factor TFIIB
MLKTNNIDNIDNIDIKSDDIWDIIDSLENNKNTEGENIDVNKCRECNSSNIYIDNRYGTKICEDCALTLDYKLDSSPDWNSVNSTDDTNSRCGCPTNIYFPNSSLGTKVQNGKFSKISMLEKWSNMPYKERSKYEVFKYIDKKCTEAKISRPIIDNAKNLFNTLSKVSNEDDSSKSIIIRGLNRKSIIAACVFNGSNLQGYPRTPHEIGKIFGITSKQLTKGNRKFRDIMIKEKIINNVKSSQSDEFINRSEYTKMLKLDEIHINVAKCIARNIKKLDLASNHQPASVAASSIMLMATIFKLNISKKMISDVYNISQVTIIKAYRIIFNWRKILISDEATNKFLEISKKNVIVDDESDTDSDDELHISKECFADEYNSNSNLIDFDKSESITEESINKEDYLTDESTSQDKKEISKEKNLINRYT